MSADYKLRAEVLAEAIGAGFLTVDDAVTWADSVVANESEPDVEIIDVALSRSRPNAEVISRLRAVKGFINQDNLTPALLREMLVALTKDSSLAPRMARYLEHISHARLPETIYGTEAWWMGEHFDPNEPGAPTLSEAVGILREYLTKYAGKA